MLLRRYGANVQSVEPHFEAKALNEISFRRDHAHSLATEDFEAKWQPVGTVELRAEAAGEVHNEAEQQMLDDLAAQVQAQLDGLGAGEALLIENDPGIDWPRTRQHSRTVVEGQENRLHFTVTVEPALRLTRYRRGA